MDDSVEAQVAFQRPLGSASQDIVGQVLGLLRASGMAFSEVEDERFARPLSWHRVAGTANSTSALRLVFADAAQAAAAKALLHDKAVRVGADLLTMSFSDEVSLVAAAKNGSRRG